MRSDLPARSESVTTLFAEDLTAPEFAWFVNAQTAVVLPVAASGLHLAAFDLNRPGAAG
jgi:hypothetical protein